MDEKLSILCDHCGGEGRIPLSPPYQFVLEYLYRMGAATMKEIMEGSRENLSWTGWRKRMELLLRYHLVERVKMGGVWVYSLPEKGGR